MRLALLCWLFVVFLICTLAERSTIRIGGLYQGEHEELTSAMKAAVEHVNNDRTILPRYQLVAQTEKVPPRDSFHACSKVCELMRVGVAAIFGPQSEFTSEHVQSVCDTMELPHIETRWDTRQRRGACAVNLYPHPSTIAKVLFDLVEAWEWKSFTIIYEDAGGLVRVNELLRMYDPKGHTITVRQLEHGDNHRPLLRRIKNTEEMNIVLDCSIEKLPEVLKQAQQVGLMASYHSYIISTLDMHTIDLEPYQYGGTNITGIRLVDPNDPTVRSAVREIAEMSRNLSLTPEILRMDTALVYDAVLLFAHALRWLDHSQRVSVRPLNCETEENWEHGYSLINYIKVSEMKGMTGVTRFDNQGFRSHLVLDIVELGMDGLTSIGTWNSSEGVNLTRVHQAQLEQRTDSLANKTFVVLTALSAPYGMLREASQKLNGNDRFEGFGIELIQEISNMLGFNYSFLLQHDGAYGSLDKSTGKWNGMIREMLEYRADLAITDLTITYERESAVDFTMPFMNLGISILYRKPSKQAPSLFSFMSPFSNEVWVYMFITYIGVSVLLFALARCSPYEWTNPYPCIEEPDHLENQFSLKNSLWFTIGSLMQQGSDIAPTAVSTRMVAGIWWFFTLIMVSSYTANLAAFLTIESLVSPIKSLDDLANQNVIKYGAKRGGSTASFFRDSNNTLHQRIWQFMENNPDVMTSSNDEGIQRVKTTNGKYAFFMESSSIEYVVERECDLSQVGGLLDAKGYGIAMRKNSPYRNAISAAVLKLQEVGKMYALKIKWWKEKRGGGQCKDDSAGSGAASELGLPNVGGVFVVLIVGVGFAAILAMLELCWSVGQSSRQYKIPFWREVGSEVKFALKCKGSTKPVRIRESPDSPDLEDTASEQDEGGMENFVPLSPYAVPPNVVKGKQDASS